MKPECELGSSVGKGAFQGSASSAAWSSKLKPDHFERSAIVYVRQSTAQQVLSYCQKLWMRIFQAAAWVLIPSVNLRP